MREDERPIHLFHIYIHIINPFVVQPITDEYIFLNEKYLYYFKRKYDKMVLKMAIEMANISYLHYSYLFHITSIFTIPFNTHLHYPYLKIINDIMYRYWLLKC